MGVKERRDREREARRKEILRAGEAVFAEKGFQSATMEDIAKRAELSVGALYLYFRSKEDLFISMIFEAMDVFHLGLVAVENNSKTAEAKLRDLWSLFIRFREEHPMYYKALLHLHDRDFTRFLSPPVKEVILRRSGENFDLGARIMAAAGSSRPRAAIELIWAAFMGLVYIQDTRQGLSPSFDQRQSRNFFLKAYRGLETGLVGNRKRGPRPAPRRGRRAGNPVEPQ